MPRNYAFLSDFDLLRDTRQDIRQKPWAQAPNRDLMNRWFKLERAREEIQRLDIEIRRFVTYMRDEESYLLAVEHELQASDSTLAFHVRQYRLDRTRFFSVHRQRLLTLCKLDGFKGSLMPGVSEDPTLRAKTHEQNASISAHQRTLDPAPLLTKHVGVDDMDVDIDHAEDCNPASTHNSDASASEDEDSDNEGIHHPGEEEYLEGRFKVLEISGLP